MNTKNLLEIFDREQRSGIEYPDMRKEVEPYVVRFIRPAPGLSFVLYSRLDRTNADQIIKDQVVYFTENDYQPFSWKVYEHDTPSDLKKRLEAHGFVPEDEKLDAVMVLKLVHIPPSLLEPVVGDVRRLSNPDQLSDVIQVEREVWGGDFGWILKRLGAHMAVPDYLSVYVAYVDGEPACTGWIYFHPKSQFASLWGGSTVPRYRNQGLYTAVLAARAQEAQKRGRRFLTVDASPMSRPIIAKQGFHLLTHAQEFEWRGD